ncbi:uncharacterized protein [Diabrotica undecimpunctata]|uniref:uncharacterized protein n=1 Tax=Diabrotica undecimpunctata TaxID=50387 RepID=UPI003B640035
MMQSIQFLVLFLTLTVTSVVSRCGKVFYDQDNEYKIYCFKESEGISSIKLTNNVTIIEEVQSTDNGECFKVIKPQQTNEISCMQLLEENCVSDTEVNKTEWTEESDIIKCKKVGNGNEEYNGIKNGNLTVLFKINIVIPSSWNSLIHVPRRAPKRE